jgi:multiple sugar transport system substrate-binding protein
MVRSLRSPSPSTVGLPLFDRRTVLKGLASVAGAAAFMPVLSACGDGSSGSNSKIVTLGSNGSDAKPRAAYEAAMQAFQKQAGLTVTVNTTDHQAFQQNINNYLQGTPDDVFTWFAGYRMQFFANKGLLHPVDDVWQKIGANFSDAVRNLSKNPTDGHFYFVPLYNYPWGVFYRKSVFSQHGYQIPTTFEDFLTLAQKMQQDGLIPLMGCYGGGEQYMLLGTFDYLNMRTNGYQFHMDLMQGKQSWTDNRVKQVMSSWARMLPYYQPGAASLKWEDAAPALVKKQVGMAVTGMFVGQAFTDPNDLADLDFFPFPIVNPQYGTEAVEAPMDGFLLSKSPKNLSGATALMEFLGGAQAEDIYQSLDSSNLVVNSQANTGKYSDMQKRAVQMISQAKNLSQFADRDSDPGFMQNVVEPAFAQFAGNPSSANTVLSQIEAQKSQYFQS